MDKCQICGDPEQECWGREMDTGPIYGGLLEDGRPGDGEEYGPRFCPRFERRVKEQIETATTLDELKAAIADYYEIHPTGGDCHIVLDDYNYRDSSVRFCVENADTPEGKILAKKLLALSIEDRAAVNDWQFCRCGHAMSLHTRWDGNSGCSRSGPCHLPGCECAHAECVEERRLTR